MKLIYYMEDIVYLIIAVPFFIYSIKAIKEDLKVKNDYDSKLYVHIFMAVIFGVLFICSCMCIITGS